MSRAAECETNLADSEASTRLEASVPARFSRIATRHAQRLAVLGPDAELTYAQLDQSSDAIAATILAHGGNEPVVLLMDHGTQLIAGILGVLKAGRIYLALDPSASTDRLAPMLSDAGARLLLTDRNNAALARSLAQSTGTPDSSGSSPGTIAVVDLDPLPTRPSTPANLPAVAPEAGALLMYTSGSTGKPKGVWQNHRSLVHQAEVYARIIGATPDDRVALLTSCSLAASASPLFCALLHGATLCLFHVRSQGAERLSAWLREKRITIYHSVPTIFRHLARAAPDNQPFAHLRWVRLGGEPVLRSDVEIFRERCPKHCRLMHSFSSTETGLISALVLDQQTALPEGRVPVGRPVDGVEILLLDENNRPLSNGGEGRIAVRTRHSREGYWRQPAATAEQFVPDPRDPKALIFVSKDLGRVLPDGSLEHLGRTDQMTKIGGLRVDLAEVEAALHATNLFKEAAAIPVEEAQGGRRLVAYVVARADADVSGAACRRALRPLLPDHMVPQEFIELPQLPQTQGGKVDRRALEQMPRASKTPASKAPKPSDKTEWKLSLLWQHVLKLPAVGTRDDFFDLGGTSLQAIEIITKIEEYLGIALPPSTLAEHSTIEKLAAFLDDRSVLRSDNPLVVLREGGSRRPLFFIHNGAGTVSAYGQLARRLPDRPIYGLQSPGMQGESWPLASVEAMAARYLPEILRADPNGPYLLMASCMGGLVAFELAQRLSQAGRPVALVALLDVPAPPYTGQRSPWHEAILDPVRDALRIWNWSFRRMIGRSVGPQQLPDYRHFVKSMNSRAHRRYRPRFYNGAITIITAADKVYPKGDRRLMMSRYAKEARHVAIVGNKRSLLYPPGIDELARQLEPLLAK